MFIYVAISILLLSIIFLLVYLTREQEFNQLLKVLSIVVNIGFWLFMALRIVLLIVSVTKLQYTYILLLTVINEAVITMFFIFIYYSTLLLLKNLNNDIIFSYENCDYIKDISKQFFYLSITEISFGFVLSLIMIGTGGFEFVTNDSVFAFIVIGVVLQIISLILRKATEIHLENELTI